MKLNNPFSSFANCYFQFVKKSKNSPYVQQVLEGTLRPNWCTISCTGVFSAVALYPCGAVPALSDVLVHK